MLVYRCDTERRFQMSHDAQLLCCLLTYNVCQSVLRSNVSMVICLSAARYCEDGSWICRSMRPQRCPNACDVDAPVKKNTIRCRYLPDL